MTAPCTIFSRVQDDLDSKTTLEHKKKVPALYFPLEHAMDQSLLSTEAIQPMIRNKKTITRLNTIIAWTAQPERHADSSSPDGLFESNPILH